MNFLELPIVSATTISDTTTGEPFTTNARNLAYWGEFNLFIGTDAGTVYAARVQNDLYFVCISSGYYGYTWLSNSAAVGKYALTSTQWSTIYDVKALSIPTSYTWNLEFTNFSDEQTMLEMFYNTYVNTDPDAGEAVVVSVVAYPDDPVDDGGTSGPGGGDGEYDDGSDPMPIPGIPAISAANSGLITIFRPSLAQLQDLGKYLWTNISDFIENLQKMFSNPMDYFIAFHIMPAVPDTLPLRTLKLGLWETSIQMPPVKNQFYEFDCGTVTVSPYWNSALDYSPYTKIQLFLPFIGAVSLNTDEVMGNMIGITYRMDLLSGQCVALVTINGDVYYQFTGECSVAVPLTGADWSRVYSAAIGAVGTAITGTISAAGSGVAAGAATSAMAAGNATRAVSSAGDAFAHVAETTRGLRGAPAARQALLDSMQASVQAAQNAAQNSGTVSAGIRASRIANTINNTVGSVMSGKLTISHSGSISSSAGMLGIRTPYLIIEYPNQSLADNYKHFVGYPSNIYSRLGDLSGYTEMEQVLPTGIWGTDDELAELVESLKSGVYL